MNADLIFRAECRGEVPLDPVKVRDVLIDRGRKHVWEIDDARPHFVYRAFDAAGELLYIGCTKRPWGRMDDHRRSSAWWGAATRVTWECPGDFADARAVEAEAIRTELPIHNRSLNPVAGVQPLEGAGDTSPGPAAGADRGSLSKRGAA